MANGRVLSKLTATLKRVETSITKIGGTIRSVDARLNNVQKNMATNRDTLRLDTKIVRMERSLKLRMGKQKNEILDYFRKIAETTPTLNEFKKLKDRVDRYHPLSD